MPRIALAVPLLGLALIGCGAPSVALPAALTTQQAPSSWSPTSAATTAPSATNGATPQSCYDGECEITVSRPMSFPVDPRFGFDTISITSIGSESVTIKATGRGVSWATVGPGSNVRLNGLRSHVLRISDGTAVLRFFR